MARDYIPLQRGDYRAWLNNIETQSPANGPVIGASAADVTAVVNQAASQIALMTATDDAKRALRSARAAEREGKAATNQLLRRKFGLWKRMDNFSVAHEVALRVKSRKKSFDPSTFQPKFKGRAIPGGVRLDWTKGGVDGVIVFGRLHGQTEWTKIGVDLFSPFLDARPLSVPGVAEVREYKMLGMVNDGAIGQDSAVVSVTWDGQ